MVHSFTLLFSLFLIDLLAHSEQFIPTVAKEVRLADMLTGGLAKSVLSLATRRNGLLYQCTKATMGRGQHTSVVGPMRRRSIRTGEMTLKIAATDVSFALLRYTSL